MNVELVNTTAIAMPHVVTLMVHSLVLVKIRTKGMEQRARVRLLICNALSSIYGSESKTLNYPCFQKPHLP